MLTAPVMPHIPPLEAGDHLGQTTFHERYKAMPSGFRAELIGGVVIVPWPLKPEHAECHALTMMWLGQYWVATLGTRVRENATAILGNAGIIKDQADYGPLYRRAAEHGYTPSWC